MKKKISMKKTLSMLFSVAIACTCLSSCSLKQTAKGGKMDISNVTIPTFADTEGLVICAYSGPTVENWSGTSRNVSTLTDEHMQKLVDAGFTRLHAIHEGGWGAKGNSVYDYVKNTTDKAVEDAVIALELCEKYGIEYMVRDWNLYDCRNFVDDLSTPQDEGLDTREEIEKAMDIILDGQDYIYSPAFYGHLGADEPGAHQFDLIKIWMDVYYEKLAELGVEGEFHFNLLPAYGSITSYGGVTYTEYVEQYFEKIAPTLGYVSYDYYPFLKDNTKGSLLRTSYISNLELMANLCKKNNVELRTFICTGADFTGLRDLTSIGDFRFQMYTTMAFGTRDITYYEYGTFKSQHEGEFGLINLQDGTYNYTYDLAKQVNNEVHAFEDAYLHYNYDGVMCFSALPEGKININFRGVNNLLESHPRIANVEHTQDTLLTSFKDAEGNDAFMLVNYTDPFFDLDDRVTIQFNDAKGLLMYRFGQEYIVPLNADGTYTFELYPGEGRFIIPLK